jgi:hypothetical protein
MVDHLEAWGELRRKYQASLITTTRTSLAPPQIVAWSDPSDLLSWNVPELKAVVVKNRTAKNSIHWLWLFESPTRAHDNYAINKGVLRVMLKPTNRTRAQ